MKTIWKYPFKSNTWNTLTMPKGAQILKLATQHGMVTIWALVETARPTEDREFGIFATGEQIHAREGQLRFIDTFFVDGGNYVFHVFELISQPPRPASNQSAIDRAVERLTDEAKLEEMANKNK